MSKQYNIMIMGASYGSLLASKLMFGGHNLTLADIMMVYTLTTSRAFSATPLAALPNTRAYLLRIGERAAYRQAMAKAEPGMKPLLE